MAKNSFVTKPFVILSMVCYIVIEELGEIFGELKKE